MMREQNVLNRQSGEKMNKQSGKAWLAAAIAIAFTAISASAATFGSMQIVNGVRVHSIFKGSYGAVYVTFTPSNLTGCNGNYGGYLSSTWPDAMVGSPTDATAPQAQLALLLSAKAMDSTLEVRYRVNTTGTGWDKCAIDAIWLL
jgi:hypothetical protein